MSRTTSYGVPLKLISPGSQGHINCNEDLDAIGVLLAGRIVTRSLSAPPGSPTAGDAYIVGASPTGDWSTANGGGADKIAYYHASNGWKFIVPKEGTIMYDIELAVPVQYHSDGWDVMNAPDYSDNQHCGTSPLEAWYPVGVSGAGAPTTATGPNGHIYAYPLVLGRKRVIDRFAVEVTSADAGTPGEARVGVYRPASKSNLYPGDLVEDVGTFDQSTTGVKTINPSPLTLEAGFYWVVLAQVGTAQMRGWASSNFRNVLGLSSTLGNSIPGVGWDLTTAYAALADPFPNGAARLNPASLPAVFVRFSA